jgi:hypothetical protein
MRYVAEEAKIFEFKGLTGKILKTKEIGFYKIHFRYSPL